MKIGEIREKDSAELLKEEEALRKEFWLLRHKAQTEPIDRPNRVTEIRRSIARILTVLRERELAEKNPS
jgi:large subunit ribosomal protein L29